MRRSLAIVLAGGLVLSVFACGDGDDGQTRSQTPGSTSGTDGKLSAQVASYDLAVGPPARLLVGVFDNERGPVGYGNVSLRFFYLGDKQPAPKPEPGPQATAAYVPLPGSPPAAGPVDRPVFLPKAERGVYAARVAFDRPGRWGVLVETELDGARQTASATFPVLPTHEVPVTGDAAPRSENLTVSTPGAHPEAIDSRAQGGTPVPDPELHQTTVAKALGAGRPVVLVVSTPTYCVSQFCGPITEMVGELADQYGDRATFVHIEVWKNYEAKALNEAAKDWIARGENVNEPWVFLIGSDGTVTARFDNVASRGELEPMLQALPVPGG